MPRSARPGRESKPAPLSHQGTHLDENARQHFRQTGVGLGGDDEQRIARTIVDPVIRIGRQRDTGGLSGWGRKRRLTTQISPEGLTTTYTYQNGGQQTTITYSSGATQIIAN